MAARVEWTRKDSRAITAPATTSQPLDSDGSATSIEPASEDSCTTTTQARNAQASDSADSARSASCTNPTLEYCHFTALPPEIRNNVYEQVFAFEIVESRLLGASPPSHALLFACKQVYEEAKEMYKVQYKQYWEKVCSLPAHYKGFVLVLARSRSQFL